MYLNDPNAIMCKQGVNFFRSLLLIEGINRISVRFLHGIFIETWLINFDNIRCIHNVAIIRLKITTFYFTWIYIFLKGFYPSIKILNVAHPYQQEQNCNISLINDRKNISFCRSLFKSDLGFTSDRVQSIEINHHKLIPMHLHSI